MKLSPHKFAQYRTHHEIDVDMDGEFWPMMGILFTIWGAWTGIVHFLDWLTVDAIAWYVEPWTILPLLFLLIMKEKFDSLNPLHWWPMFFGYKIAGAKFEAVKESSDALDGAFESPDFGFWESFGKMLLAEKPDASGTLVQDAMANWKTFWMFPSIMALVVAGIFFVSFFDKGSSEEISTKEQD